MGTLIDLPRILFITSSRIGDAVLSSGVLAQVLESSPAARVTIACAPLAAPLFADLPGLERLHPIIRKRFGAHWWELWKASAGNHWSVVVDLRGSLIAWTLAADRRLVCRAQKRHEHRIAELARQLGLPSLPSPHLWVSATRQARADATLGAGPPILAVGPTANWGAKMWPAERFAEAVLRLTAADGILPGARIAVLGAAAERPLAAPVLAAVPADRRLDLIGMPDLLDAFAILRRCSFYLGNDSGLMHMVAAAGIPTLGLFGPSAEWRYAPWGERTTVVRTKESFDELCGGPEFDHRRQETLMRGLSTDMVIDAARGLWERCGGTQSAICRSNEF